MNSKQLVLNTLEFSNKTGSVPRQLWALPWAGDKFPDELRKIQTDFPSDFDSVPSFCRETPKTHGDPYVVGKYVDEWGAKFVNYQKGVIGEVKDPLVKGEEWEDVDNIHIPTEWLSIDKEEINRACKVKKDKFIIGGCCPRPFEQLQFIRGTELFYMDLMTRPKAMMDFIGKMHAFYCELMEAWAKTDVDALNFMDDWGSQNTLLINPKTWVEIFKPMYKDYIDIAHSHGKKIFMHSDGNTNDIYPHLIELGLDAFNSQIFCIGIDNLRKYKGKITFWGEIDRQNLLPYADKKEIEEAVKAVHSALWDNGGCIAQCEFGIGAKPENVYEVFKTWDSFNK